MTPFRGRAKRGMGARIVCSVSASAVFAVLYYYAGILGPLSGEQVYAWRMVTTLPFLAAYVVLSGRWDLVRSIGRRTSREPILWLALPASAALVGVQFWIFMWAPVNGYALDVSLGYFLLPLTLVAASRIVFKERISRSQAVACAIAAIGVANEFAAADAISWPAFVVAGLYPVYYVLRRILRTDNLGGLLIDIALAEPFACWILASSEPGPSALGGLPTAAVLIAGLGILSASSIALMVTSSQLLPLGLFGLLSYVEPMLLVVVSLSLGERLAGHQWLTYGFVWLAVAVLVVNGIRKASTRRPSC